MTFTVRAAAAAAAFALAPLAANAFTLGPSHISAVTGGGDPVTADGVSTPGSRTDLDHAIDGDISTFYSLTPNGSLTIDVTPLRFAGPTSLIEVTFNSPNADFPESAKVFFNDTLAGELFNDGTATQEANFSITAAIFGSGQNSGVTYTIEFVTGVFRTLTLLDTTLVNFAAFYAPNTNRTTDGFDVNDIRVNAVPLPPAALLLLAGLGALSFASRRRRAA